MTLDLGDLGPTFSTQYVRVLMSASSNTCDTHDQPPQQHDVRNCVGYALFEIGVGTLSGSTFTDLVNHVASQAQSKIYVSSQDSWSDPSYYANVATRDIEQPGLDMIFTNGLTFANPVMVPVAILYGTPDNAVAEITYLKNRGYAISRVELGEEPDGQAMVPEDYGALYVQWATALHARYPDLKLSGPALQGVFYPGAATLSSCLANPAANGLLCENATWPLTPGGETRWMARFLSYLQHETLPSDLRSVLGWFDVEHYPFSAACDDSAESDARVWSNILAEPSFIQGQLKLWQADAAQAGLSLGPNGGIPIYFTEYNYSALPSKTLVDLPAALWQADFVGSSLTAGVNGVFYYTGEPSNLGPLDKVCTSYGAMSKLYADANDKYLSPYSTYFSNILMTQQWAQMGNSVHQVYPATSDIKDGMGNVLVTAYPVLRPDGQWAVLVVNKDRTNTHSFTVTFNDASTGENKFFGAPTMLSFGPDQYVWNASGGNGYPTYPKPFPATTKPSGGSGAVYTVPAASVTVLRGSINAPGTTPVYQINSGGPAVAPFTTDAFFSAGQTGSPATTDISTSGVSNPAPKAVYQTERWGGDASFNPAPFSYTFTSLTAGASYTVRLHFAETYWNTVGQRIFNVAINGTPVLTNFDIVAVAGGKNKANVQQFTTTADGSGQIVVSFTVGAADAPKVSGIEILQ